MGFFDATIEAALAGRTVRATPLVHFDFLTTPKRLWPGFGSLLAGGQTWSGLGELGSISGLESALGGTAPETTFTLSGVDPDIVSAALAAPEEVKLRPVTVYIQAFDEAWQTLDAPVALYLGQMDVMRVRTDGPTSRTVEVTAETLFARRAFSPWAYWSDRDQKRRFSGDRGLEYISLMTNKTANWPPPLDTE